MKKFILLAVAAVAALAVWSCSDDKEEALQPNQLPAEAQTTIEMYFSNLDIISVEKEGKGTKTTYDVWFSDGTKVEFDSLGSWKDVDAPYGKAVPADIVPPLIADYVAANYPDELINEISRDVRGYDIELTNGLDLEFDSEGNFLRVDR